MGIYRNVEILTLDKNSQWEKAFSLGYTLFAPIYSYNRGGGDFRVLKKMFK